MDFTIELIKNNITEIGHLTKLHYAEVAPHDDIPLKVDWERFMMLENAGAFKFFVVRKSRKMIGYAMFFVSYSIEYSESLQASMANIFIHPDHRGQGLDFIQWCDEQLKNMGVQVVYHHVKVKKDYGKALERLGYEKMNIEYSKRLDK